MNTNKYLRAGARLALIVSAVIAGILNGSVLAAPVLIFMAYLLSVLVAQGRAAVTLIEQERLRNATVGSRVITEDEGRALVQAFNARYPVVTKFGGQR